MFTASVGLSVTLFILFQSESIQFLEFDPVVVATVRKIPLMGTSACYKHNIFHCGRFRKRELYRLCLFETLVCYWKFKKFFNRTRASSYENFHRSIFVQMFQKRSETEKEFFLKKKKRTKKKTSSKCLYVHVKLNVKNFRHSSVRKKKWIHYVRASKADTYSRWRRKNWVLYSKKFQERWSVQFVSVFFFIIVIIIV